MQNIEIKARLRDVNRAILKAKELSGADGVKIQQYDIFFKSKEGRLKLRKFEDGTAELILYERPNVLGPKMSSYNKINLQADIVNPLADILSQSIGVLGTVEKTRLLYLVGQTRIHIDNVNNLGNFIELEVLLKKDEDIENGHKIANNLMQELSIEEDDLIAVAYIDLLNRIDHT